MRSFGYEAIFLAEYWRWWVFFRVLMCFYFPGLTPLCWWKRALKWWVWMLVTKCWNMHWSQGGKGEKSRLSTGGVSSSVLPTNSVLYGLELTVVCIRCSVIEEANWLTLAEDVQKPGDGFDAVICLGNSFAHLPDFKGGLREQSHLLTSHFTHRSSRHRTSDLTLCVVMPIRGPEWPEVGPAEHRQHGQTRRHPHHRSPQLRLHPGDWPGASGKEHLL